VVTHIKDNIYRIEVVLPENPLKLLNSYFIQGAPGEKNLLIDTGFRRPECWDALSAGLEELHARPEETDVFLTHLHSDHTGNAPRLQKLGSRVLMGRIDNALMHKDTWKQQMARAVTEGFDPEELDRVFLHNPAVIYSPEPFEPEDLDEGDVLCYGGRRLECVHTPGHTRGHMCLYDREDRLMFLGDCVLFDITPNIIGWHEGTDPLHRYIETLRKVAEFDVVTPLPGHRTTGGWTMRDRALFLIDHHDVRLKEVVNIIDREPGLNAYEISARMNWQIRTKDWEHFPPGQKWFAVGECLAHLEFLMVEGMAERYIDSETQARTYYLAR
jgi:glyoxylase-like metal-dependent hydrolase (beta-lactamase superfamily II)